MSRILFTTIVFIGFNTIVYSQQFSDVTKSVGIEHIHVSRVLMGGGAAFIDYDNDGWQDIFMTGGERPDALYRNIEGRVFEDMSSTLPFIKGTNISSAVVALDYDGNGCRDLFITTINKDFPNVLLQNNCDGTFSNVSSIAGINESAYSMGANISDVNNDGWPDIYVINYVQNEKFLRDNENVVIGYEHDCYANFLYLNDGSGGFIESSSSESFSGRGCGLAVANIDFLENGDKGFYVANDFGEWVEPNEMFVWGDTTKSSEDYGLDVGLYGMGIGVGDIDDDLDFDLYITNIGKNALMVNENSIFENKAAEYNVENEFVQDSLYAISWGAFFADIDNDRDQDLFVSNGFIISAPFLRGGQLDPSKMFENQTGNFVDVTDDWGLTNFGVNRGAIYGDYDNDGFLDILVSSISEDNLGSNENLTFKLYRNNGNDNNFVKIILDGAVDHDAYGSIVTVYAGGGARKQILLSSATHASQHEKSLIFGLGQLTLVDSINVSWADGSQQVYDNLEINQTYKLSQINNQVSLLGCTDQNASNYNSMATENYGCIEPTATSTLNLDEIELDVYVNGPHLYFSGNRTTYGSIDVDIYNIIGQRRIHRVNHDLDTIDLNILRSGIYVVAIRLNGTQFTKKIVVFNE